MESYLSPIFEKETEQQSYHVPTWLRNRDCSVVWEWEADCIYDTEFGNYIPKDTLEEYSKSFDFSTEEQEEFLTKLRKL